MTSSADKHHEDVFSVSLRLVPLHIEKPDLHYVLGMVRGLVASIAGFHPVEGLTNDSFYEKEHFDIHFGHRAKAELFVKLAGRYLSQEALKLLSISTDPDHIRHSRVLVRNKDA